MPEYTIFINLPMKPQKTWYPTFKDAFLFLSHLIMSEEVQKKFKIDPYDTTRVNSEFWIFEGKGKGNRLIRFDEAIRMAENFGIANPFLRETNAGNRLRIVINGIAIQQSFPNFTEAFLNMCYFAKKMGKRRKCENWIYVPNGECHYGTKKVYNGRIIYLDTAIKIADEIGVPHPFREARRK